MGCGGAAPGKTQVAPDVADRTTVTGGATASPLRCPDCGANVAEVVLTVDGRPVQMRSCNRCDRRWWTSDGEPVDPLSLFAKR
jgi:hypothetical protein